MVRETYGPDKGTAAAHRIVVLVDGSANADAAFEAAIQYKKHEHHLLVVHSVNLVRPWTAGPHAGPYLDANTLHKTNESLVHAAKHMLAKYSKCAQQLKVPNVQAYVITSDENPKDAALHFAKEQNAKLIVIGSRGISGLQRLLMGSFSNHVVNNAFCDVLVARTSGHKSIKELPGLLGTATRQDLAKISMAQPLVHPEASPKDAATKQHELQGAIKQKVAEKQKEITELLEQLSLAEQQREEEFHIAEREYTKRKDSETAHAVADAQRNEEARAKAQKEKDELAAQIKRKEDEIRRLREDQDKVVAQYKQQVVENEQRTREKQEAIADSRRRSDDAEKERQRLASLLRLTEDKSEKERLKLEKERKQLEDLAHSREQESEQQRALRVQQLKEKEAELENERARQAHGRQELALAIAARDKQIAEELAKEKRLESEVEAERKRERDLDKQCKELGAKLERLHKTHSDDLTHLRTEMVEKESKWQSDRNEYRQQLQTEKQNLLRIIQQKECELEAERAKRKEAELLRSKDTESRIHEKASASRMLREEAQRTEREAEAQLEAQRALSKRKADEARQAEERAASVHAAEGRFESTTTVHTASDEHREHEHEEHHEREQHHTAEQQRVVGTGGAHEGKSCLIS